MREVAGSEGFMHDMLAMVTEGISWSPGQLEAITRIYAQQRTRAASQHIGTVRERLRDLKVTVECCNQYWRETSFYPYKQADIWTNLRDEQGNLIFVRSSTFYADRGATLVIAGTVKEHSEHKSQKQTRLERVKITSPTD